MTHDEMIAVIQAHKDGKTIQVRGKGRPKWHDRTRPSWDFDSCDYRVKPEPRVAYFAEYTNPYGGNVLTQGRFDTKEDLQKTLDSWAVRPTYRIVKFVEVLDDA